MKKVLIPTDFSDNSKVALDYAIELYKDAPCSFYVLNTYDQLVTSDHFDVAVATNLKALQMLKKNSETQLKKIETYFKKKNTNANQQIKTISQIGTLIAAVKDVVNKEAIDVIIMGTKGESSSSNIIFGSSTLQVINKRIAPVIAVPNEYNFSEIKHILFPTDLYIEFRDKHLKFLLDIAKQTKSKITLLHKIFRGLNTVQRENKAKLENYLSEINPLFETIEEKEIDEAIYDYEQSHPTELLAMINNKHSFIENLFFTPVVSKIVKHTKIPFLVIPS
ncbi:MAG: universal stress protein [Flavobacteriaceae bacterium]|nr:universal stress protein [Flavobacteriaceae bacterium]